VIGVGVWWVLYDKKEQNPDKEVGKSKTPYSLSRIGFILIGLNVASREENVLASIAKRATYKT
jgi:hypothetical protein